MIGPVAYNPFSQSYRRVDPTRVSPGETMAFSITGGGGHAMSIKQMFMVLPPSGIT